MDHAKAVALVSFVLAACKRPASDIAPASRDVAITDPSARSSTVSPSGSVTTGIAIQTRVQMDSEPFESKPERAALAIFPAADPGPNARAIMLFESGGEYETALAPGRYDLCAGGSILTVCMHGTGASRSRSRNCPTDASDCTCTPPDDQRSAWKGGQTFEVAPNAVTRIIATTGYFPGTHFGCASLVGGVCK